MTHIVGPYPPWYRRLSFYSLLVTALVTVVGGSFIIGAMDSVIKANAAMLKTHQALEMHPGVVEDLQEIKTNQRWIMKQLGWKEP